MNYPDPKSESAKLFGLAKRVLPDGGSRSTIRIDPYSIYVKEARGKYVIDADDNKLFDLNLNYTSMIHGHAHPRIVDAARRQINRGTAYSFASEPELALAELLCSRVDAFERIRFMNSGTEAVMNAIKAARAFTGKSKIAKCENAYHGSYDYAEVSLGVPPTDLADGDPVATPYSAGTPKNVLDDVVVLPFNDTAATLRILEDNADDIAAVLIDPLGLNMARTPPSDDYLQKIQSFCANNIALFVADEVVAFRAASNGLQGARNFAPDLTTLGKIIGGGFPVGAVAGSAEVMSVFETGGGRARLPHGGTYNANPVTMAAGYVAMDMMTDDEYARINALGDEFRQGVQEVFDLTATEGKVEGQYSIFCLTLSDPALSQATASGQVYRSEGLHRYMVRNGYWMTPGLVGVLSTAMDSTDVAPFCETLMAGIRVLKSQSAA